MDDFFRDPDMAPQLIEMLHKKLKSTREALEGMTKDNGALRAEVVKLEGAQRNSNGLSSRDEAALREELSRARQENTRLQDEITDCRKTIAKADASRAAEARVRSEGSGCTGVNCQSHRDLQRAHKDLAETRSHLDQQERAYDEMRERVDEQNDALARLQAAHDDSRRRAAHLDDALDAARKECEQFKAAYEDSQRHAGRLDDAFDAEREKRELAESRLDAARQQIAKNREDLDGKLEQFEESRQKWRAKEDELVKLNYALKQEQELMTNKYWRYKSKFLEIANAPPPVQAVLTQDRATSGTVPAAYSSAQPAVPSSSKHDRGEPNALPVLSKPWYEIVKNVLDNPCFPPHDYRAPFHLPPHVKEHIPKGTAVLCCPNRLIFPFSDGFARVIAPSAQCKGARAATELQPPSHELEKHVGSRREVFYTAEHGICYAGTFLGVAVGDVPREEYAQFGKLVKEAVLRHTFPGKHEFTAASQADASRVRNLYMNGVWTTRFLALEYLGHNQPLADALAALGAMQREGQVEESQGRPAGRGTDRASSPPPERARTPHRVETQRRDDRARTPSLPPPERPPPLREDEGLWERARADAQAPLGWDEPPYEEPRARSSPYEDDGEHPRPVLDRDDRDRADASPAPQPTDQEWDELARLTPEPMGEMAGRRAHTPPYAADDGMVDGEHMPPPRAYSPRARGVEYHSDRRMVGDGGVPLASRLSDAPAASPPWSPGAEVGSDAEAYVRPRAAPLFARLSAGRVRTKRRAGADPEDGARRNGAKRVCSGTYRREERR
ncbi:hypothetical protein PsYK624_105090 [Phanerochaete sordida]|uniref:Uncharacterized protein n=1 Tax=Phanerochaete sordida TaxID=48140 RepID=A0A9P3GG73_9APHY|nr:hypothetical protein PsYK624_105090 [Phanerochaete sordida]